jgi:5-formyltetrahydrofolate cyclo-ligase
VVATKEDLRARVLAARRAAGAEQRLRAASRATRFLLDLPDVVAARCVAAYFSFGTEPSTAVLLAELRSRDVRVLLPVLCSDLDLDWAIYDESAAGAKDVRGVWTPAGPRLGVDAVAAADVVVVPALAVGHDGTRLGRGGGSYDRALARVPAARVVATLLYEGELLAEVPREPHDRAVDVVALPSGVRRLRGAARRDTR